MRATRESFVVTRNKFEATNMTMSCIVKTQLWPSQKAWMTNSHPGSLAENTTLAVTNGFHIAKACRRQSLCRTATKLRWVKRVNRDRTEANLELPREAPVSRGFPRLQQPAGFADVEEHRGSSLAVYLSRSRKPPRTWTGLGYPCRPHNKSNW